MITLALLLSGCGGERLPEAEGLRNLYRNMEACVMEAAVSCDQDGEPWRAELRCEYVPDAASSVEVLSPDTIAGVRAVLEADTWSLRFEGLHLDAGAVSREAVSPAACLPRLMDALRNGWLLEENGEEWDGIPCLRLALDQSGREAEKVDSILWLRTADGTPVRGEIAVDGETVLTADFTGFSFLDTPENG